MEADGGGQGWVEGAGRPASLPVSRKLGRAQRRWVESEARLGGVGMPPAPRSVAALA